MGAGELPQGIRIAAERFAAACERDGCGGIVANVGAEHGKVLWVSFNSEELGVHESFVRLHDGTYMRSIAFKEAFDEQLP